MSVGLHFYVLQLENPDWLILNFFRDRKAFKNWCFKKINKNEHIEIAQGKKVWDKQHATQW